MKKYLPLVLVTFIVTLSAVNFSCQKISCALKSDLPWCASTLKDADKEYTAGNYEKAISLYQAYLNDKPAENKIEEVNGKISEAYYNLGEKSFNARNWPEAITFYSQSQNPDAQNRISKCYFNLGEESLAKNEYQTAIDYYSKSQEPGVQDKIKAAQDTLALAQGATVVPGATVTPGATVQKPVPPPLIYAVSLVTFSSKADAQARVSELKGQGVKAYYTGSDSKGWTVYAGKYATRTQAENAMNKLMGISKQYRAAFVVKLK